MGVRADLVWRTVTLPETDWAIAEAAKVWSPQDNKYISESKFKLPRQLHDVLVGRTMEVGGANELRDVLVSGLIIGGNVALFLFFFRWDLYGTCPNRCS